MARQQRNDVDYFPHSVNHGKKMFHIRDKFNNDGYAVWFMLLENLGKANYHFLDLHDEIELMFLSSQLKVSEELLNEIINVLVKLKEFDKELWDEEKILFNQKFTENVSDAYKKRINDCVNEYSIIDVLISKGRLNEAIWRPKQLKRIPIDINPPIKGCENPQRIVKDTKGKETIYEDRENFFEIFYFKNYVYPLKEVDEFINYYEARDWTPKGMDKPIVDKVALARTWKQTVDKGQSVTTAISPSIMRKWSQFYNNCKKELSPEELEKLLRCQPYEENGDYLLVRSENKLSAETINSYGDRIGKHFKTTFPGLTLKWKGKTKL